MHLLKQLEQQSKSRGFKWTFQEHYDGYRTLYNDEGIVLLGYQNDSLKFWTDNKVPIEEILTRDIFNKRFMRLQNGFYEVIHHPGEDRQFYGLILVKTMYAFENDYLINSFHSDFNIDVPTRLADEEDPQLPAIYSSDGVYFVFPQGERSGKTSDWKYFLVVFLWVSGAVLLLLFLIRAVKWLTPRIGSLWAILTLVVSVLGLRGYALYEFYPMVFSDLELFNPAWYGTSFLFPSLGDLLINALLFLFLAWAIRKYWWPRFKTLPPRIWVQVCLGILAPGVIYVYSSFLTSLFRGLIKDSSINFEVNDLFGLDWYSYVGILIIGILFLSAFVLCNKTIEVFIRSGMKERKFYIYLVLVTAIHVTVHHLLGMQDLILVLWPTFLLLILAWVHYRREGQYEFTSVLLVLFLVSFAASHTLSRYTGKKEHENRQVFAEKLTSNEDPVAEWEFPALENRLVTSNWLFEPLDTANVYSKMEIERRIRQEFFDGYWDKYEVTAHYFDRDSLPAGKESKALPFKHFESLILLYGTPTDLSHNLYYIHNSGEKLNYLIMLQDYDAGGELRGTLFMELASKLIPEELGFPALLLGKNNREIEDLSHYSNARYVDRRLIVSNGDYHYPLTLDIFESIKGKDPSTALTGTITFSSRRMNKRSLF